MRALVVTAVGTVALAFVALACTGGDGVDRARLEAPCTNEATMEAFTPVHVHERTPGVPNVQPDDERFCRLRRAMITLDELDGWRWDTLVRGRADDVLTYSQGSGFWFGCYTGAPGYHDGLHYWFEPDVDDNDESVLSLRHWVFAVPAGGGDAYMRASRMHCEDKRDRTDHDDKWTRIEVPAVGEDREGWEVASSSSFGDHVLVERIVWLRRGDVISVVVALGRDGDLDQVDLDSIVRLAAEKLTLVGPMPELPSWVEDCELEPRPTPSVPTDALARAVVRDEDMRQGWIEITREECGLFESDAFCDPVDAEPPVRPLAQVSFSLEHGERGAFFHGVRIYAEGDGRDMMQWLSQTFSESASCVATSHGERFTWRLSPLEFDRFGNETVAYQISTRMDQQDYMYKYVWWRRGDAIATVGYLESPRWSDLPAIVEAADAKFAAAAEEINRLNR